MLYILLGKNDKTKWKKENSDLFVFVFSLRGFLHCHMSIALCVLTILLILLLLLVSTNSLALHVNFRHAWYSWLYCTCSCGASQSQVNVMVLFSRHSHHSGFHLGLFRLPASPYSVVNRTVCQCPCSCLLPGIVKEGFIDVSLSSQTIYITHPCNWIETNRANWVVLICLAYLNQPVMPPNKIHS